MNWNIFYIINQEFVNILLVGFIYTIMIASIFLAIRWLINSLKEDRED
jgi:hypothetical protein